MSRAFSVFRPSLSLLRLGVLGSLLCFKSSAVAAPLRWSCFALILAALSVAVVGAQPADDWVIETVAGSPNFSDGDGGATVLPRGVALDGAGNLYIAEWGNQRIPRWTLWG